FRNIILAGSIPPILSHLFSRKYLFCLNLDKISFIRFMLCIVSLPVSGHMLAGKSAYVTLLLATNINLLVVLF
ncbi:MAG: hypothetical protein CVU78_08230, partial [Elusimicrobia bacterium HGW-Elusimicrobia-2]